MDSKETQTTGPLSPRERDGDRGANKLRQYAKTMRTQASDTERVLWRYLRGRGLKGYKFRRQVVIEPYIVDFACMEAKLVVEADGGQHQQQEMYDAKRTKRLQQAGYKVLRFWNHEILNETAAVLEVIARELD